MGFSMFIAKKPCSYLACFIETFNAKMGCRIAAVLAFHFGHIVAGHQCDGMFRRGFSFPRTKDMDLGLGSCPKIVEMEQVWLFRKHIVSLAGFAYLVPLPTTNRELTQVPAAFQPDIAQIRIQLIEIRRAAHFKIQPEVSVMGGLHAHVPQSLLGLPAGIRGLNNFCTLFALPKVTGHTALGGLLIAVLTLSA
jgi:hypothetical protein